MDSVRKSLNKLREFSAHYHRCFLPDGYLASVLTREVIHCLLSEAHVTGPEDLSQTVDEIHSKASKVFATLVLMESEGVLIKRFLNRGLYDNKLPFNLQDLSLDVGLKAQGEKWIEEFIHKQYIFLAPVFRKGANYDPMDSKYVLPFNKEERIGQGAYEVVYKMQIHANHQLLQASPNGKFEAEWFARKEFKITPDCGKMFEREKSVMRQLLKLEHPNIVPLLATYSHDDHFNMIFPLADMTLHDYLRLDGDKPSGCGGPITALFQGACDLAKALCHIHNFEIVEDGKEFKFLGYHHDLKPKNILVQNGRFLIADFGLANLKKPDQSSKTALRVSTGAYSPPEAIREDVGRAYDIWSFGCVLAEIVTFAVKGAEGVERFGKDRTTIVAPGIENDCFHDGMKIKLEVLNHFDELRSLAASPLKTTVPRILRLVEKMLEPDASQRPLSGDVLAMLKDILNTPNSSSPSLGLSYDASTSLQSHQAEDFSTPRISLPSTFPCSNQLASSPFDLTSNQPSIEETAPVSWGFSEKPKTEDLTTPTNISEKRRPRPVNNKRGTIARLWEIFCFSIFWVLQTVKQNDDEPTHSANEGYLYMKYSRNIPTEILENSQPAP